MLNEVVFAGIIGKTLLFAVIGVIAVIFVIIWLIKKVL
jgi:hypothetical protein